MEKEVTNWEKFLVSETTDEGHRFRMCCEISKLKKRTQNLVLKIGKLSEKTL